MLIRQAVKETIKRLNKFYSTEFNGIVLDLRVFLDEESFFAICSNVDETKVESIDVVTLSEDGVECNVIINTNGFSRSKHNINQTIDYSNISKYVKLVRYDINEDKFFQMSLIDDLFVDFEQLKELATLVPKMNELWRKQNDCNA